MLKLVNLQLHDKIKLGLAIKQFKQFNNIAMFYSESMCVASQRGNRVLMKYTYMYSEMHVTVDTYMYIIGCKTLIGVHKMHDRMHPN